MLCERPVLPKHAKLLPCSIISLHRHEISYIIQGGNKLPKKKKKRGLPIRWLSKFGRSWNDNFNNQKILQKWQWSKNYLGFLKFGIPSIPLWVTAERTWWSSIVYLFSCSLYFYWRPLKCYNASVYPCSTNQMSTFPLEKFKPATEATPACQVWRRLWNSSAIVFCWHGLHCIAYTEVGKNVAPLSLSWSSPSLSL